jgi:NAD(P)-dependent dehydrogenase (short-subunit alcohol dehydrogenase family)
MLRNMELNGTAAVVSGGASGLGEATARVLAAAGATVIVADLNGENGKRVAGDIGGLFVRTDVADETSVQAAVDVAAAIARTEPADADGQRGVVINTASVAGLEGQTGQIAYSASKGGIIGMTLPAARDLSAIGVRVNTICPGIIDTPIYGFSENAEEFKARLVAPVVFPKRMGRADEFGQLVRSLIENDYMNAEVIRFDGGIRFQPKLCLVMSSFRLTCGDALSASFPTRLGRHWAVRCRADRAAKIASTCHSDAS